MLKMLEMCSYEQTLLLKTSNIVSKDVYSKMLIYKRLACKSFSSFTNFCQYCSRPLDLSSKSSETSSIVSSLSNPTVIAAATASLNISPSVDLVTEFQQRNSSTTTNAELDPKMGISIYNCGHSFHLSCLEIIQVQSNSTCPVCNSSSTTTAAYKMAQQNSASKLKLKYANKTSNKKVNALGNSLSAANLSELANGDDVNEQTINNLNFIDDMATKKPSSSNNNNQPMTSQSEANNDSEVNGTIKLSTNTNGYNFMLTERQLSALKSTRTRNLSTFQIGLNNSSYSMSFSKSSSQIGYYGSNNKAIVSNTMLEKQSKLSLSPANLSKFI